MKKILLFLTLIYTAVQAVGQSYDAQVATYIDHFKDVAIAEQVRCGIPASITLAQGILESAAGTSELCLNAQNHFGIKCKSNWQGMTYAYTDDAKDECFRKYKDAFTSYKDHSDFLKNSKRYASLFEYSVEDYQAWAKGLKRCGYASNPQYAVKLIQIVEKYNLQQYTLIASSSPSSPYYQQDILADVKRPAAGEYIPDEQPAAYNAYATSATASSSERPDRTAYYTTTTYNGLKGFYAPKGDLLLEYAIKHRIRYSRLLELNDLYDQPLEADMFIYLEKKKKTGPEETYIVLPGETLLMIAQSTGMQLESLRNLNHISPGLEPEPGSILYLQNPAPDQPQTYMAGAHELSKPVVPASAAASSDYIATRQPDDAPESLYETEDVPDSETPAQYNIANETSVEETSGTDMPASAPTLSELDQLKARLDKSVYAEPEDDAVADDTDETAYYTTQEDAVDDAEAALREHMQAVKSGKNSDYTPKANEDKQIKVNNRSSYASTTSTAAPKKNIAANKTPAKKPVATAKKPVTKKPTTTHSKKPSTVKKPVAKKK